MRILFDGFWWSRGPFSNQQVLREFIFAWEREFAQDELVVAVPTRNVAAARVEIPERVRLVQTRLRPQGISAILELPVLATVHGADWILTHNFSPIFGRSAVFVHDLIFVTNPGWFTRAERAYFSLMPATLSRARHIFTSSSTEAVRIDSVGRGRRAAVPVGLSIPPGLTHAELAPVPGLHGLEGFVLVVGRLNVRKNLEIALQGALLSKTIRPQLPVIVVGEPSGRVSELPFAVTEAMSNGTIKFTGFISDQQLAWLYSRARLFLFLSLDEGFGIPNLEALSFGTPVLASDIPVFREILRTNAAFVDPRDVKAVASAVDAALADESRLEPIDPATLGFSWAQSVRKIRAVLMQTGQ